MRTLRPCSLAPVLHVLPLLVGGLLLAGSLSCSDDDAPAPADAGPAGDLAQGDQQVTDDAGAEAGPDLAQAPDQAVLPPNSNMGEGCFGPPDCKEASPVCLRPIGDPEVGVCTAVCKIDNPATPEDEDQCPSGYTCSYFKKSGGGYDFYCLKSCVPSLTQNPCPESSQQTCHPLSDRFTNLHHHAVCADPACRDGRDCPAFSDIPCVTDTQCAGMGDDAYCIEGTCAFPGTCSPSGICGPHGRGKSGSQVGDPCLSDLDCPDNGVCLPEEHNIFGPVPHYPNGYCSVPNCAFADDIPEFACPAGSACTRIFNGGLCLKTCDLGDASTCRGQPADKGGDYDCYAFQNLILEGSIPVAEAPVCASAGAEVCNGLGAQISCTDLGDDQNSTNMTCRDPLTGAPLTNSQSPDGVCLDDTASGDFRGAR